MIKVLVADDHMVVRLGIRKILEESGIQIAGEVASGESALEWLDDNECDVIILDISMPGMSGIDVLRELHYRVPNLPVLILSIYPVEQYADTLIHIGAMGYLSKDSVAPRLVEAVRCVNGGVRYVENLRNHIDVDNKPPHLRLSPREYAVFLQLASACSVKEIALSLSLSVNTVSTYRRRILDKMNLPNNAEIMRYAVANMLPIVAK